MKTFDRLKKPNLLVKTVLLLGKNRFGKKHSQFSKITSNNNEVPTRYCRLKCFYEIDFCS